MKGDMDSKATCVDHSAEAAGYFLGGGGEELSYFLETEGQWGALVLRF